MKYIITLCIALTLYAGLCAQTWTKVGTMPINGRFSTLTLTYNGKAYTFGGLFTHTTFTDTCYEYNPVTKGWKAIARFPGGRRSDMPGFVYNGKAYLGQGEDDSTYTCHADWYAFDFATNTWTPKTKMPGLPRIGAAYFVLGHYGYIAGGSKGATPYLNDAYRYDFLTDKWDTIASLPLTGRSVLKGFAENGYGYAVGGFTGTSLVRDLVQYDTSTNSWHKRASIPDSTFAGVSTFSACGKRYVMMGTVGDTSGKINTQYSRSVYMYDAINDKWIKKSPFPGSPRKEALGFDINGVGYIVSGWDGTTDFKEVWRYAPHIDSTIRSIAGGCSTDSILLSTNFNNAKYYWSNGSNAHNITVNGGKKYWVTIAGTRCISDTFDIIYVPKSKSGFTYTVNKDTITFTDTTSNYASVLWLFGNGDTSMAVNPVYAYPTNGSYTVKLISYNPPCANDTFTETIKVPTRVKDIRDIYKLYIYPNPANNTMHLLLNRIPQNTELVVLNSLGQAVMQKITLPTSANPVNKDINISSWPTGVYFIQLRSNQGVSTYTFTKE